MPAPKRRLTAFAVAMAVLIATPLVVGASDSFVDVPDANVHHDDIAWLADAGVTKGCNPPDNTEFCPGDAVLRQQMASFLRRLAENQIVDAATVQGLTPADLKSNVTIYDAGPYDFAPLGYLYLTIPGIPAEEAMNSAWQVEVVRPAGNVYALPGLGVNGQTEYRVYWYVDPDNDEVEVIIQLSSGPGEEYASVRLIRVEATALTPLAAIVNDSGVPPTEE